MGLMTVAIGWLIIKGVGIWAQHPHRLGFAIVNFVWWIGIGHAGTLISAFYSAESEVAHLHQPLLRKP